MFDAAHIRTYLEAHPYPRLFLTMSGAHLYGFPSPDSDYDLRGAHITPARALLGLVEPRLTYEVMDKDAPIEMDLVTHDAGKFLRMLLNKNGYVLEQIFSPIVVEAHPVFEELKSIARQVVTCHHRHHFRSFASQQWDRVSGPATGTVKGLLYTYRPLLAGIYLMRTGQIESNLRVLNEEFALSYIDDLIDAKVSGAEKQALGDRDMGFHRAEFERLNALLDAESESSSLPETPPGDARAALNDLLIRLRLENG
jgi:uncharacterized protein